ncbi:MULTISPECIES: hypothetical protein [Thermus]|jgi:hypothetical protein|uniref:Outer membrane protein beta-barrel domain-containing protein n=1 Tax=Thermus brockianus TaxID=56956 RepID=A0A1J0LQT1_THEBO|nr:hypothetical protein [Thermus brockianus]APD08681.1 hypothetical protein A0O31_00473 [Thermus brockianus]BDG15960.1 hypothetical protein TbrSNM41_06940 [Thermus brockianus]
MRKTIGLLLLLALGSLAFAQRAVSFRLSLPPAGLGFGLEAPLEQNLAFRGFADLFPGGPSFLVGGELLFKPDLGQVDRDLRGIRPYFGGGLAGWFAQSSDLGLHLSLGVEVLLDPRTGVFLDGEYFYPFGGGNSLSRVVLGASLR